MAMDAKGFVPTYFGKLVKDGPNKGHYSMDVNIGKGKSAVTVFTLLDVIVWVPVTEEAAAAAFSGFTFRPTEPDGTKHATTGMLAGCGAKYMHAVETPRGAIRAKAVKLQKDGKSVEEIRAALNANADAYRASFESFRAVGGGEETGGKRVVPLTEDEYEKAYRDGTLKALLTVRGML